MNQHRTTRGAPLAGVLVAALLLAACGGTDAADDPPAPEPADETIVEEEDEASEPADGSANDDLDEGSSVDLAAVCPETIVFQLDWQPQSEHGMIYSMVGEGYVVDDDIKAVTGPLVTSAGATGVDIEVRIGGPPVGFQDAQSLLYQDPDIMFGFGRIGEMFTTQDRLPLVGVLATMEKSPYSIYWDPETHPDVETIGDLGEQEIQVLVGPGTNVWADWFVAEGLWTEDQIFRSDFAKPATFIAAGGADAEAGFATSEPFLYEVEVADEWGRPVRIELIHDAGFEEYFQVLVVREADVQEQADCLEALVPVIQQAGVDFAENPGPVHEFIVELVERYDTGWINSIPTTEFAFAKMRELGIFSNGPDGIYGSFDLDRIEGLRDIVASVSDPAIAELDAEGLATNRFLDPSIALP